MKKFFTSTLIATLMLVPGVACAATSAPESSTEASAKHEPNMRGLFLCWFIGNC